MSQRSECLSGARSFNEFFGRQAIHSQVCDILKNFETHLSNVNFKKGIYIYGSSGVGKTRFITEVLRAMDYDIISYDAGDVRNKALVDQIASNNISTCNVLDLMRRRVRKIAIVMDEIDGMNNGDKGGLSALIKLIRQKKTKKQKMENMTLNPIICIGNYYVDKKIKELMKVCHVFELKSPTPAQMLLWVQHQFPVLSPAQHGWITAYANGDLRKLDFVQRLQRHDPALINATTLQSVLNLKTFSDDTNKITKSLILRKYRFDEHNQVMNETDRTTVALLWHENIVDVIPPRFCDSSDFYLRFLQNTCYADYIDRITFQYQIWQFNEISSLMKTFHNNRLYHESFEGVPGCASAAKRHEIRFTKVLTKYSTEFNNQGFVYELCQKMDMERRDLVAFFLHMRIFFQKYWPMVVPFSTVSPSSSSSSSSTSGNGQGGMATATAATSADCLPLFTSLQSLESRYAQHRKSFPSTPTTTAASSSFEDILNNTVFMNMLERIFDDMQITKLDIRRFYRYLERNSKKDITGTTIGLDAFGDGSGAADLLDEYVSPTPFHHYDQDSD